MRTRTASVLLAILFASPALGADDLATGIRYVQEGDFEAAVVALEGVVRDLALQTGRTRELAEAYLYLGVAHVALDQTSAARARFRDALARDRRLRLTPDRFSPKVIAVFEEARREAAGGGREEALKKDGGGRKAWLFAGLGGATAAGVAFTVSRGGREASSSPVRFTAASLSPPVLDCPDGGHSNRVVTALVAVTNDSGVSLTLNDALLSLTMAVPGSGFGNLTQTRATVSPAIVGSRQSTTLRVESFFICDNLPGGAPYAEDFSAQVTLMTSAGSFGINVPNGLHVNYP